jgi:hypothetical protein
MGPDSNERAKQHWNHEARPSKACLHHPTPNRRSVMDIKQELVVGFKRLYQDLDIVAVVSGIAAGCLCIIVSRLINGPQGGHWLGAVVAASIGATCLAKQRERSRRNTGDPVREPELKGEV